MMQFLISKLDLRLNAIHARQIFIEKYAAEASGTPAAGRSSIPGQVTFFFATSMQYMSLFVIKQSANVQLIKWWSVEGLMDDW